MAGGEEKSRYELLEISDPSTLLVRGELDKMIEIRVCFIYDYCSGAFHFVNSYFWTDLISQCLLKLL